MKNWNSVSFYYENCIYGLNEIDKPSGYLLFTPSSFFFMININMLFACSKDVEGLVTIAIIWPKYLAVQLLLLLLFAFLFYLVQLHFQLTVITVHTLHESMNASPVWGSFQIMPLWSSPHFPACIASLEFYHWKIFCAAMLWMVNIMISARMTTTTMVLLVLINHPHIKNGNAYCRAPHIHP